jgi:SAM-dependent methyltransferase
MGDETSDAALDTILAQDKRARAACETAAKSAVAIVAAADQIERTLAAVSACDPCAHFLVLTFDLIELPAASSHEAVIYRVPSSGLDADGRLLASGSHQLPFASGLFDIVIGNRLARIGTDSVPLVREAFRVLKPGGSFILLAQPSDFGSAPLPEAATAHLVRRVLRAAGIDNSRFIQNTLP